ncbi:MAG: dienelactone hydrolase family protein [Phenylobacterium sp.]|uniref:dienelactone hydrolase family protein n=1 Tax=Phenylobacterium sp. TaxID=1871053 RepID=UPI0025EF9809|nr:dienelactone hydrolase family protein [Phenylobacterium sp.]MCA3726433.1 dienelactone hydrolase family protein [Phenylobacterium sp.]MCA6240615.1 dienelactone hydrolase family protein [Phenylobacterium sp.]MCA6260284.1 dienelactone hydrolase family protein [Phenylobacterium sp.]
MATRGQMIRMKMSDGAEIGVYHAQPTKARRRGGLVLIQEIFGVTEHIKEQCDQFADQGYEVLAPALYDREVPGFEASYSPEDIQRAMQVARVQHDFQVSLADAQTCIDALKDKGPVFMTGYCYGGSVTWAMACRSRDLAAASGYYGGLIPAMADQTPNCPTILHFGQHDHGIPMEGVRKVAELHPEVAVHVYDAGHGFQSDRRADYHEPSAKLARERTLALFRANGG